jgi:hypothetical protein
MWRSRISKVCEPRFPDKVLLVVHPGWSTFKALHIVYSTDDATTPRHIDIYPTIGWDGH